MKVLMSRLSLAVFAAVLGCSRPKDAAPRGPLGRVFIDSAGALSFNGQAITPAALAESLRVLAALHGGVIYSRANAGTDPNALQEPVMQQTLMTIAANKLPVRLVPPESLATVGR